MSTYDLSTIERMNAQTAIQLITENDLSGLSGPQRVQVVLAMCDELGLNPLTKPIQLLTLDGKLVAYVTKGATDQMANNRGVSTRIVDRGRDGHTYYAIVEARTQDGRTAEEIGVVSLEVYSRANQQHRPATTAETANAMMKAVTKAKRRAILSLIGLGLMAQEEAEDLVQDGRANYAALDAEVQREEAIAEAQVAQEELEDAAANWRAAWDGVTNHDEFQQLYATYKPQPGNVKLLCRSSVEAAMKRTGTIFTNGKFERAQQ
jgi:hypothetical protein